MTPDDRILAATREAGHALAEVVLGGTFYCVSISLGQALG